MNEHVSMNPPMKKKAARPGGGQKEKALGALLKKAMAISKKAMASEDLALLEQAIGLWHEVLEISPNSPIARRHLAAAEEKRQIMQAALLWNESVSDKTQAAPEGGIDLSASILMDLRKAARAMTGSEANLKKQLLLWKKILEISPQDEEALAEIEKIEGEIARRGGEGKRPTEVKLKASARKEAPEPQAPKQEEGLLCCKGIAEVSHGFVQPEPSEMIPISPLSEEEQQEGPPIHFDPPGEANAEEIPQNQFFFSNALSDEPGDDTHRFGQDGTEGLDPQALANEAPGFEVGDDRPFGMVDRGEASLPAFEALNGQASGFSFASGEEEAPAPPGAVEPVDLSNTDLPPIENLVSGMEIEGSGLDDLPGLESALAEGKTVDLASALIGSTQELSHFIADYLEPELKKEKPKRKRRPRVRRTTSPAAVLGFFGLTSLVAACVALFLFAAQVRPAVGPHLKRLGYGILKVGYAMEFLKARESEIERITAQREVDFAALLFSNKKYARAIRHCQNALKASLLEPALKAQIEAKATTLLQKIHDRFVRLGRYYERRGWRYRRKAVESYKLAFAADPLDTELNVKIYNLEKKLKRR